MTLSSFLNALSLQLFLEYKSTRFYGLYDMTCYCNGVFISVLFFLQPLNIKFACVLQTPYKSLSCSSNNTVGLHAMYFHDFSLN